MKRKRNWNKGKEKWNKGKEKWNKEKEKWNKEKEKEKEKWNKKNEVMNARISKDVGLMILLWNFAVSPINWCYLHNKNISIASILSITDEEKDKR